MIWDMVLQFGHGGEAVETLIVGGAANDHDAGFNSATAVKPWRPRLQHRGHGRSRSFNSATAVKPWRPGVSCAILSVGPGVLQFGHGGEAVETSRTRPPAA